MNTVFLLMAEFETADIPLKDCCEKYFGLQIKEACRKAATQKLPVPVFRGGSQKSGWLISAQDLANFLDQKREDARNDWKRLNGNEAA
ncbi:MAG: pyocin activator PrtN family protein [Cellvibrionaceae bacterium]